MQEAAALQEDLRRAGVEPYGWVLKATLTGSRAQDPLLLHRAALEQPHLRLVREHLAGWRYLIDLRGHAAWQQARSGGAGRSGLTARRIVTNGPAVAHAARRTVVV